MTDPQTVVKVGGSLFDLPDLGARLESWLKTLPERETLLIAGGGAPASFIREMDRVHQLGEVNSHWLALRALSVTAHLLAKLASPTLPLVLIPHSHGRQGAWMQERIPVLDPLEFFLRDWGRPGALPHRWDVTSDSLAARVAEVLKAPELVLLKSVTVPPWIKWPEASRRGLVDGYFPTLTARGVKARVVNLRKWARDRFAEQID